MPPPQDLFEMLEARIDFPVELYDPGVGVLRVQKEVLLSRQHRALLRQQPLRTTFAEPLTAVSEDHHRRLS